MARTRSSAGILAAAAVALVAAALVFQHALDASMNERSLAPRGTRIQVPAGASLRSVLAELARVGAVHRPRLVEWYLRLHGGHLLAQAGIYELAEGATAHAILDQLNAGQVVLSQVTIVEGWTFAQMRAALNANGDLQHDWQRLDDAALMRALGQAGVPAEGRFFPDTYRFAAGTSDRRIYELAWQRMNERLHAEWAARDPSVSLANADAA
ncbi:MAG: endolytic transglycosylase MltG, partial [Gammaproteobacteria bacterium]|nr:endolytic transglycosylase MltG [Gammaproteobacteria bacterium]